MSRNPPQQAAAPAPPPPLHPLFFGAGNESSKGSSSTTLAEYGFSFDYDNDSGGGERTSLFMPLNGGGGSSSSHHDLGELLDFSSSSYYDCPAEALLLPQRPLSSTGSAATTTTATATMYSPPESTASGVTMSSMPLDFAAEEVSPSSGPASCGAAIVTGGGGGGALPEETCFSSSAVTSRDPSPLNGNSKGYVCLAYKCSAAFSRVEDLELHGRTAHQHFCLWGERCRCGGGFATREELSWHVKKEHLLVCPVLGCRESSFPSKEVVDCHLKWAHGGIAKAEAGSDGVVSHSGAAAAAGGGGTGLLRAPPVATSLSQQPQSHPQSEDMSSSTLPGPGVSSKLKRRTCESAREDRILKMQMSIGIAKKRCRDQLRMVVEKRFRRMNGANSTTRSTGDSPGMLISSPTTTKLVESASFPLVWEHGVLPFLIEFMPKWSSGPGGVAGGGGEGHVISVMRGKKPQTRRICIMTETAISRARRIVIAGHVRDLLPTPYRKTTSFAFSTGEVERLRVWARGLGKAMPDEVCEPRNPFCYVSPCMGDSIGVTLAGSGDEITATLGPCLTIADGSSYWLANFHPFVEAAQAAAVTDATTMVTVSHPSPEDRARCVDGRHDVLSADPRDFGLGTLAATSRRTC
ncbi:putative zinc finger protein 585a protein [Eutypa lata UCREL1]|uniref:Putative zinc finger protein 585a protein n=1 Tax=Eutypa lata (strain UCR-EL1) TaxID=1287681 RepID=M7SUH2_EUTLA|nr:putative zinc finger protein 585a protein [Eutypa lata UCREL1]